MNRLVQFLARNKLKLLVAVCVIGALFFLFRPQAQKPPETQAAVKKDITQSISVSGTVVSEHTANLNFLAGGKLIYLGVRKGDRVVTGQTIAALDTRTVQKNLEGALRDYSKQRNTFDATQDANGNRTQNQALNDAMKRVLQNNQYDLDKAIISVQLQELVKQQSYIVSPIDGYVTRADVDVSGVNVGATTLFTITDLDHMVFQADVDEADVAKVLVKLPARINLDAFPNRSIMLFVDSVDYASHTTSTGGTAYTVSLRIPEDIAFRLRVGMNGDAEIILDERKHVLVVPASSIVDGKYVFVKTKDGFEKRQVLVGLQNDTQAQIREGLAAGDQVALQASSVKPSTGRLRIPFIGPFFKTGARVR